MCLVIQDSAEEVAISDFSVSLFVQRMLKEISIVIAFTGFSILTNNQIVFCKSSSVNIFCHEHICILGALFIVFTK